MIISQHGQTAINQMTFLDRFDWLAKRTEYLTSHLVTLAMAVCVIALWAMYWPVLPL